MKRARSLHQDEESLERAVRRPWPLGARQTSTLEERWNNTLSNAKNTIYGTTIARDESTVVVGDNYGAIHTHHHHYPEEINQPFRVLLDSLTFDRIHARLHNVAQALPNTCQWLFDHYCFTTWKAAGGLLWIKGKPGSGKSTIMKEVHACVENEWSSHCVLSYFFNARSHNGLEKSPLGLYRSLLHQLLSKIGAGYDSFVSTFAYKIKTDHKAGGRMECIVTEDWTEVERTPTIVAMAVPRRCSQR